MDPHQFEAIVAISEIKNFYGSVDSIKNRKIFRKSKGSLQSKILREKQVVEQKAVEAECHELAAEFSGIA